MFVKAAAVGAAGTPVNVGLASGAKAVLVYAFVPKVPPVPMFSVEASVPVKVKLLLAVRVLPSAMVSVDPVAGAVIATLLTLVAVATPMVGVVKVGDVANTARPVPVSSDNAPASPAELVSVFCLPDTAAVACASAYAVVATAVVLLLAAWVTATVPVGRVTVPVKVGLARLAFKLSAVVTKAVVAT